MNIQETNRVMKEIKMGYPYFFGKLTKEDGNDMPLPSQKSIKRF